LARAAPELAAITRAKTLVTNVTTCPSPNKSPTASRQNVAGAAKESAAARSGTPGRDCGTPNHGVVAARPANLAGMQLQLKLHPT